MANPRLILDRMPPQIIIVPTPGKVLYGFIYGKVACKWDPAGVLRRVPVEDMLIPSVKPWPIFDKINSAFRLENFSIQKMRELLMSKFRPFEQRYISIKRWEPTHQAYTFGDQQPKFEMTVEILHEAYRVLTEDLMRLGTAARYELSGRE